MNKLYKTLKELDILNRHKINYVLTRFNTLSGRIDDLDILVKHEDFKKTIDLLVEESFGSFSHDQALGGRVKGAQRNLVKSGCIKIDLHRDFTWRSTHYLDINLIWENLEKEKIAGIWCALPKKEIDIFIILINLIFEKTYITKEEYDYVKKYFPKIFTDPIFDAQAKKYGWLKTYRLFKKWFNEINKPEKFPIFLPVWLVFFSYIEKSLHDKRIHTVSLLYYVFFRVRFVVNRRLPYE